MGLLTVDMVGNVAAVTGGVLAGGLLGPRLPGNLPPNIKDGLLIAVGLLIVSQTSGVVRSVGVGLAVAGGLNLIRRNALIAN